MTTQFARILRNTLLVITFICLAASTGIEAANRKSKPAEAVRESKDSKRRHDSKVGKPQNSRDRATSRTAKQDSKSTGDRRAAVTKSGAVKNDKKRSSAESKRETLARLREEHGKPSKKQRAAELRRAEQQRRAEAARLAAIARERARDEELRNYVQSLIAKDDLSGEDPEVRRVAVNALGNHAGTVVVMNPQTGRIYSIVNQQWAIREGFKPCSTIKLVTGVAGLNEDVINSSDTTKISDTNQVSLTRALAYSKNHYFQVVGEQVGFDKMLTYARQLGLGERTGINARNEFKGRVPESNDFRAIHRMSSHGDHYQVTALQLATMVSAMGNGGKLLTPYIVRTRQDEAKLKTKVRKHVSLDQETLRQMVPGMVGAVNYGSGRRAHDPRQTIAGKTGTCIEQGTWVGLFTSYAPLANPKLAVVVIARGADARSHFPAAVAGRIYRELGTGYGGATGLQVAASRDLNVRESEEEDDEEEAEALAAETHKTTRPVESLLRSDRSAAGKVKPVLMTIPSVPQAIEPTATRSSSTSSGATRPRRVLGTK
jgi:penicillin-binding protein 2